MIDTDTRHPGESLRELIKDKGDTISGAARIMGIPIRYLSLIVNKKRGIGIGVVSKICKYLYGEQDPETVTGWICAQQRWNLKNLKPKGKKNKLKKGAVNGSIDN